MVSKEDRLLLKELRQNIDGVASEDLPDYVLLVHLRGKMDVKRATRSFNLFLEHKEDLGGWDRHMMNFLDYEPPEVISENLKYKYLGIDYDGRLVFWLPAGHWEVRKHLENGMLNSMFLHFYKCFDEGFQQLYFEGEKSGKHKKVVILLDLEGMSFSKIANYEMIKIVLSLLRDFHCFANMMHKFYILNGPRVANYMRKLARPFLSKKTDGKVVQLSLEESEWKEVLRENFPEQILPVEYGGTRPSLKWI